MSVDERMSAGRTLKPEMCSLNMGSMNFTLHRALKRFKEWKYEWEPGYLARSEGNIFPNTFVDIKRILKDVGEAGGTRFEFECYDLGHLYNLASLLEDGTVKPPLFVQSIFGILGGMGVDPENVMFMRNTADRLFGRENYRWSVLGAGRHQMALVTMSAILGGNVRVGLEDSIYLGKGLLAKSNAEQVRKIRAILEALSLEIATPAEVREMLKLKGKENVAF
jgi:uncharacterized protein (DUF849 family)